MLITRSEGTGGPARSKTAGGGRNASLWAFVVMMSIVAGVLVVFHSGTQIRRGGLRDGAGKRRTASGHSGSRMQGKKGNQDRAKLKDCFDHDGAEYTGRVSTTQSGRRCQRWDAQVPNAHDMHRYADLFGSPLEENFCRNPSGEIEGPWCFNGEGTEPRWEPCDIPRCKESINAPVNVTVRVGVSAHPSRGSVKNSQVRHFDCPGSYIVSASTYRTMRKYDLITKEAAYASNTTPLHYYSMYGATSLAQWDTIVRAHVHRVNYRQGENVFEAGSAAGAFVDSVQRQYGVNIAGVDISQAAISTARKRLHGTFCAADAASIPFVPTESFDHSLSFGVLMYAKDVVQACRIAQELIRVVKVGGTVFLGQINDPDMKAFSGKRAEGEWEVPALFWYRFAYEGGHDVEILKGEDVYSRRKIPFLDHYDLYAALRYNVYLRKGTRRGVLDCATFRSGTAARRAVEGRAAACALPFTHCGEMCKRTGKGLLLDECTTVGNASGREWCSLVPDFRGDFSSSDWGYCTPLTHLQEERQIFPPN